MQNSITKALRIRKQAIGTWIQTRSPEACEIAGLSGFDFLIIDMEHGSFGWESVVEMIRAVDCTPASAVVRLPSDSPHDVKKAVDAGAVGLLIPGIQSAEQASRVVKAARYGPRGDRGACPSVRATAHGIYPWHSYSAWADENILVWGLIETPSAVENIEAIVESGLDAIVTGPFDLSVAMGLGGGINHPQVQQALERMVEAANRRAVDCVVVVFATSPDEIAKAYSRWREKGCRIVVTLSDRWCLTQAYQQTLEALRDADK
jgi:2-keto-3-deoxy-L-rhamnonate aldolase RhmA